LHLQTFLRMLHGGLNEQRLSLIKRTFRTIGGDPDDTEGKVSPTALKEAFAADGHPSVTKGTVDPEAALSEFMNTFSLLAHIRGGCRDGTVAFSDFLAYYHVVSSTVESDSYFSMLMSRVWPQAGQESPRRSASPGRRQTRNAEDSVYARDGLSPERANSPKRDSHHRFARKTDVPGSPPGFSPLTRSSIVFNDIASGEPGMLLHRAREQLARRGLKGWRGLRERFDQDDHRKDGTVNRLDWQRISRCSGLGLSLEEQEVLYHAFPARKGGAMQYREFLRQLRGPLSEQRANAIANLFDSMAEGGAVPARKLKSSFDPSNTPSTVLGTRDAASERADFDTMVDYLARGGNLDSDQFADLLTMLSTTCYEEDEFKLMTTSAFRLRSPKARAGGS